MGMLKHGVKAIAINKGQTKLTITLGNRQRMVFEVSHPEEWLDYRAIPGPYYKGGDTDPVIKEIWRKKEELQAEARGLTATIPSKRLLEACGVEPSKVDWSNLFSLPICLSSKRARRYPGKNQQYSEREY